MNVEMLRSLTSWQERIADTKKPVFLYGMGNGADKVLRQLDKLGVKCSGVFASEGFARGTLFHGHRVTTLSEAEKECGDMLVLLSFGTSLPEVMAHIDSIAERHELIAPEVSVIGDSSFEKTVFFERLDEAERAYSLLGDDISRQIFELLTAYKITGELGYLRQAFSLNTDESKLADVPENAVYCDLGAYNGDTVLEFFHSCNGRYKKIIAFEPEKKNFQKLLRNTAQLNDIEYYNAAAWSQSCELNFSSGGGRQGAVSDKGRAIRALSLDEALKGSRADIIKYDVEGADIEALNGSRSTIEIYSPKICTAAYHRPYDYFTLINHIDSIKKGYRFTLRQDTYYPAWETNITAEI